MRGGFDRGEETVGEEEDICVDRTSEAFGSLYMYKTKGLRKDQAESQFTD